MELVRACTAFQERLTYIVAILKIGTARMDSTIRMATKIVQRWSLCKNPLYHCLDL